MMRTCALWLPCPNQGPALCLCTVSPSLQVWILTRAGGAPSVGPWQTVQASVSHQMGKGAKRLLPLSCHPQPCKGEQLTPSSAGCSLQCSQARGAEGGAPPEASCPCPQGTKCRALLACGCVPREGHRLAHIAATPQEEEKEAGERPVPLHQSLK